MEGSGGRWKVGGRSRAKSLGCSELVMPQSSFRVKDLVGTVAKSRSEWWIDATAATAWLQPTDVVVPYRTVRIYTAVHTPIPLSTPLPFPFQPSPHLHRHLRSSPFHLPLLYLRALRASSSPSPPSTPPSCLTPLYPFAIPSFASGRSNTATKRHGCTYENVTHIST